MNNRNIIRLDNILRMVSIPIAFALSFGITAILVFAIGLAYPYAIPCNFILFYPIYSGLKKAYAKYLKSKRINIEKAYEDEDNNERIESAEEYNSRTGFWE